jgi:hypothetical protein
MLEGRPLSERGSPEAGRKLAMVPASFYHPQIFSKDDLEIEKPVE